MSFFNSNVDLTLRTDLAKSYEDMAYGGSYAAIIGLFKKDTMSGDSKKIVLKNSLNPGQSSTMEQAVANGKAGPNNGLAGRAGFTVPPFKCYGTSPNIPLDQDAFTKGDNAVVALLLDESKTAMDSCKMQLDRALASDGSGCDFTIVSHSGSGPQYTLVLAEKAQLNRVVLNGTYVRQLIGGGMIETTAKYKDATVIEARPRVIIASNIQLRYGDRSETTRILQVDVAERRGPGDADWPMQLTVELPQLLAAAADAFRRLVVGTTIMPGPATLKVMEQGQEEIEAEFARVLERLVFEPAAEIEAGVLQGLADTLGIREWKYQDFCRFLRSRGVVAKRREHGRRRVWVGVGMKGLGVTGRGDGAVTGELSPLKAAS